MQPIGIQRDLSRHQPTLLNRKTLELLEGSKRIELPQDWSHRTANAPSIVHLGFGNFGRAFLPEYLLRSQVLHGRSYGICAVGMRASSQSLMNALQAQDHLFTQVYSEPEAMKIRVCNSVTTAYNAITDRDAVIAVIADSHTEEVSLTITEGGYNKENSKNAPNGILLLVEGLARRAQIASPEAKPFYVISLDNMLGNGSKTKELCLELATQCDSKLPGWIEKNVIFPTTMVDRITPQPEKSLSVFIANNFGYIDNAAILAEPFAQLVVQMPGGLPLPSFLSSATATDNILLYQKMKMRLLNAGHSSVGYAGLLAGNTFIHEIMDKALFKAFYRTLAKNEIIPSLAAIPSIDLGQYSETIVQRFSNPAIADTALRIASGGSDKIREFIVPIIKERLAADQPIDLLGMILASWFHFCLSKAGDSEPSKALDDPLSRDLITAAQGGIKAFLSQAAIFGDITDNSQVLHSVGKASERITRLGIERALQQTLADIGVIV